MNILERIISVYAPLTCVGCGKEGQNLCHDCSGMLSAPLSQCYRCNTPSTHGRTCKRCRQDSYIISANGATVYDGIAKDLIWQLKFGRVQAIASHMAREIVRHHGPMIAQDMLIVPVPTATKRVRSRGYDQAVLIARSLARQTGCAYTPLLRRIGSQEQIGAGKAQRRAQLNGAFRIKPSAKIAGVRILLIDDVMTTGATMETAAALLMASGAKAVGALVFAQATLHPDAVSEPAALNSIR